MLGEPVTAERALSLGLVTSVVDDQELVGPAQELAARLAGRPTAAYAAIKESPPYAATHSLAEALERRRRCRPPLALTRDRRTATRAFLRKEQPTLQGR